ncbi:unnamed protein product [Urochloa decumbens]|uniref:F-box domain-containing protein n=1 Tax=Urochloa decumbens TaxID=240449 RepID=A0ABC8XW00_9POAL
MTEVSRLRRPSSPDAATLPDSDDLLLEILLRLQPLPSSLPRASLVCKRWHRLVSDPGFLRRFRAHHRPPPVLGFFTSLEGEFVPTLDPPNRIPAARLTLPPHPAHVSLFIGCRNDVALLISLDLKQIIVWNLVTAHQCGVPYPSLHPLIGAVVRSARYDGQSSLCPFKLVFLCADNVHGRFVRLYESQSGAWGSMIPTTVEIFDVFLMAANVLVGNALCCLLRSGSILKVDLDTQNVAVIEKPVGITSDHLLLQYSFQILQTEGNGLGLAVVSAHNKVQLWERNTSSDGDERWFLQKTIRLDTLLSLEPSMGREVPMIVGFAEDANVIYVSTYDGLFSIELRSMEFRKISENSMRTYCYPFASFVAADGAIGGA